MSVVSIPPSTITSTRSVARRPAQPAPRRSAPLAHARDRLRAVPASPPAYSPLPAVVSADLACPVSDGRVVAYANFDHGASTPALVSVKQAVDTALRTYSSVHRGNGYASRITSAYYEAARREVRSFVGARDGDEVVFTRNTTDSFNLLARALPRHTTVFVFEAEHHATLLPWDPRRTVRLPVPASLRDAEVLLEEALSDHGGRHRLVVLSGASNVTGELWPLERFAAIAHRHGARVALDAAQYAPHRPIDLDALGLDYVAFSGHKLYAPFGAGVLAGRADWLDSAKPYLAGGGATRAVTHHGVQWQTGAARHEAGSPNVIGAVALAAACAALTRHREAIEEHEAGLGARLLDGLRAIDGVETYSIFADDHDRVAVATFTIEGLDSSLVSTALSAEHGIGVRDGKFCAHLLVDALLDDVFEEEPPTTAVRASVGLATTEEHVDRLLAAVALLAEQGPRDEYDYVEGQGWVGQRAADLDVELPW